MRQPYLRHSADQALLKIKMGCKVVSMKDPTDEMANVAAPNIPLALASGSKSPEHLITDGFDANAQVTGVI